VTHARSRPLRPPLSSGGGDGPPRRRLGGEPQRGQEPPHGVRLGHRAHDPTRAGTARTDEHLEALGSMSPLLLHLLRLHAVSQRCKGLHERDPTQCHAGLESGRRPPGRAG
jgi:hypothetical protein